MRNRFDQCRLAGAFLLVIALFLTALWRLSIERDHAVMRANRAETELGMTRAMQVVQPIPVTAHPRPIPTLRHRNDLGLLLEVEGLKKGAEIGVLKGEFAEATLRQWTSVTQYVLVDPWGFVPNYAGDMADAGNTEMQRRYDSTMKRLSRFGGVAEVCRDFSTSCARKYPDGHFDYVYIDARHDFTSVKEDLEYWWPKVRPGGIVAGHDFVNQDEGPKQTHQDWTIQPDGSRDPSGRAVRAAVEEFFNDPKHHRQIFVVYADGGFWSWVVRR